ncbi:hypothetical protein CPter91_5111 [Collimonas pratensis]|uniref:Uncharacterized protein n=1 Tax=Collimonas pratensis TaxID=279113 RepID=A0A127QBF6_9BURK|nr:hypothetical protein CPter91_5111 [Collimonas pratensis]
MGEKIEPRYQALLFFRELMMSENDGQLFHHSEKSIRLKNSANKHRRQDRKRDLAKQAIDNISVIHGRAHRKYSTQSPNCHFEQWIVSHRKSCSASKST